MQDSTIVHKPKKTTLLIMIGLFLLLTTYATVAMAQTSTVTINASVVNVRTGPGLSYDVMSQVVEDEKVQVITEQNEWYKVRISNDQVGWIASWLVDNIEISAATNLVGTITNPEVNVRAESNTDSDILGTVTEGTQLTVLFQQEGWTQVQYYNQVAWISSDLIEVEVKPKQEATSTVATENDAAAPVQQVTIRTDGTNIRSGPSIEDSVVETAFKGDSFAFVEAVNDWYLIELANGTQGYVANWVVDLSANNEAAPTANITTISEATIVIDAGHGGHDSGALAKDFYEKDVTLQTAQMLAYRLRSAGANVIMTRDSDEFIELKDRAYISNSNNADAFISLHYDSTETRNEISGTTTYYYHEEEKALADLINHNLSQYGPLPNNGVRRGDYFVLRENYRPAVLLELGYLNNDTDQQIVNTNNYRSQVVEGIYQALNQYFTP
ncbi:N-acetylmuramoyl-L-alanine amidase [Desemzia sp. RIT804]|nr:N-acetylmuramoyl-L-alanine amidase [Desemzia sp. RIT 804]